MPLVVVIAKSDTMTVDETSNYKNEVREMLEKHEIEVFTFDPAAIDQVEESHSAQLRRLFELGRGDAGGLPPALWQLGQLGHGMGLDIDEPAEAARLRGELAEAGVPNGIEQPEWKPMYGGSTGSTLPWAVMGSDESRRVYKWGRAYTAYPPHSELPALRDLLISSAEGWKALKGKASLKADAERDRRLKESSMAATLSRLVHKTLMIPRQQMALGMCALLIALIVGAAFQWNLNAVSAHENVQRQLVDCKRNVTNLGGDLQEVPCAHLTSFARACIL